MVQTRFKCKTSRTKSAAIQSPAPVHLFKIYDKMEVPLQKKENPRASLVFQILARYDLFLEEI